MGLMLLTAGLAAGFCGGSGPSHDPAAVSSLHLPDGYALRLDRPNRDPREFVATSDDGGLRVRTGPAGIIYRPDQLASAARYTARARFTEIEAPDRAPGGLRAVHRWPGLGRRSPAVYLFSGPG